MIAYFISHLHYFPIHTYPIHTYFWRFA